MCIRDSHAIIPTMELAKTDLAALPESERNILTLAGVRLLMATAAPVSYTHLFPCVNRGGICGVILYGRNKILCRKAAKTARPAAMNLSLIHI